MARPSLKLDLPDAIERREILAGRRKGIDLDRLGERYLAAGWLCDAIECFEASGNRDRLMELVPLVAERDIFLLQRLSRMPGVVVSKDDWMRAGNKALEDGRNLQAVIALDAAGDKERAAQARARAEALRAEIKPPEPRHGAGWA